MIQSHTVKLLPILAFLASACAKEVPIVESQGDCGAVFKGEMCTWSRSKGDSLIDVGAVVRLASIDSSPATAMMAWPPAAEAKLKLPESVHSKSGLTQLTVFWEAMGHPPATFATPHFDFHFYVVPVGEEMTYDCKDTSKPAALAEGYSLPDVAMPPEIAKMIGTDTLLGLCVPTMGMHSLLTTSLDAKEVFQGQIVIGYYGGKPIFIEPMVTKAMLQERKSFDLPIPTIPGLSGNYPRKFRAEYDEARQSYRFIFSEFAPGA